MTQNRIPEPAGGGETLSTLSVTSMVQFGSSSIAVSGDYVYAAGGVSGLGVVDISDPENISIATTEDFGINPDIQGVDVDPAGDYAYLGDFSTDELHVVDISTPTAPTITASAGGRGGFVNKHPSEPYVYSVDFGNTAITDVTDPANPTTTNPTNLIRNYEFGVIDSLDVLLHASGFVEDISTPDEPVPAGGHAPELAQTYWREVQADMAFADGYAYRGDTLAGTISAAEIS